MKSRKTEQLRKALRRALSYAEKAAALAAESDRAREKGELDAGQHAALTQFYQRHEKKAAAEVSRARDDLERVVSALMDECARWRRKVEEIRERASSGEGRAEELNRAHREAADRAAKLMAEAESLQQLIRANTSAQLGGFIDRGLDEYEKGAPSPTLKPSSAMGIVCAAGPIAAVASFFLMWLRAGSTAANLLGIADWYVTMGVCLAPAPWIYRFLWLAYLAPPVAGALLGIMRSRIALTAWGMVFAGLTMVIASVVPALLFGARAEHLPSLPELLGAVGPGAYAYAGVGLLFIFLGARRHDVVQLDSAKARYRVAGIVALCACCSLGALSFFFLMPAGGDLRFTVEPSDPWTGEILVQCRNGGSQPVALYIPWPGTDPDFAGSGAGADRYGIGIFAKERPGGGLRWVAQPGRCCRINGRFLGENDPVVVPPGLSGTFSIDTGILASLLGDVLEIQLVVTDARGSHLFEFECPLPEKPVPLPRPQASRRSVAPGPTTASQTSPEARLSAPPPEGRPLPPPRDPQPAHPSIMIRFRGVVGDSAAFVVMRGIGGSPEKVVVQPGDEVVTGWRLESVATSAREATLRPAGGGKPIALQRGEDQVLAGAGE